MRSWTSEPSAVGPARDRLFGGRAPFALLPVGLGLSPADRPALEAGLNNLRIVNEMPACRTGATFDWPQTAFNSPDEAGNAVAVALQNATCTFTAEPTPVPDLENVVDAALGDRHTCALTRAGAVLCAKLSVGALAYGDVWFGGRTRNSNVTTVNAGDRVCLHYNISCGDCYYCKTGHEQFCTAVQMIGHHIDGGYAEYIAVPAQNAIPLPEEISFEEGATLMCASATALHALRRGRLKDGETVAVFGVGGLGLSAIQLAKALGAADVYAVDIKQDKLELASEYGAIPVDASRVDAVEAIRSLTRGKGVDVALEIGGTTENVEVRSDAPLVDTTHVTLGRTVNQTEILNLPLVDRNVYALLDLTAGIDLSDTVNIVGMPGQSTLVNGSADTGAGSVNYSLDGGANMSGIRNTGNIVPNPDAVQEFRVQTNSYSAEHGRFGGAIVDVVRIERVTPGQVQLATLHWLATHGGGDVRVGGEAVGDPLAVHARQDRAQRLRLAAAAFQAYARLTAFLDQQGYPWLLRCWNFLHDINRGAHDQERYRQFCLGRYQALAGSPGFERQLPAATAIGMHEPGLLLYFMAGKAPGAYKQAGFGGGLLQLRAVLRLQRHQRQPVQQFGKEPFHDHPHRLRARQAAAHQVEQVLLVQPARRRPVRAAQVVGHDFQVGDRIGLRPSGEDQVAVGLERVRLLRAGVDPDHA